MMLVDTHCHIHEADYPGGGEAALKRAQAAGVGKLICVGTDEKTSAEAVRFAAEHENVWASVGLHPHEAKNGEAAIDKLRELLSTTKDYVAGPDLKAPPTSRPAKAAGSAGYPRFGHPLRDGIARDGMSKIVAIGECGLDYFYNHSPKEKQIEMLHAQIKLAQEYELPIIFHVREAFDDFWPILDQYKDLTGVLHSFTDSEENLQKALERGLCIGVNGISTFTKVEAQRLLFKNTPLERIILETDAPYLTPVPKRGTMNEPAFVTLVADFLANLRSISLKELSRATSQNASELFSI